MPAFNEVASLDETIKQCDSLAATMPIEVEVIIVDDGSTDGSNELLKSAVQDRPWLRILMHTSNQGYGVALRTGFLAARGELVFYTDADNQFDLLEVPEAVSRIGTADMLVGFRVYRFDPLSRLVVSWVYNRLVRLLFRIRVRDVDCSFKLIRRETDRLTLLSTDFFIDTELVARAESGTGALSKLASVTIRVDRARQRCDRVTFQKPSRLSGGCGAKSIFRAELNRRSDRLETRGYVRG